MKILCIGGGPGGLYFSILMKKLDPSHEIRVVERNAPDDTFGFGVVFSDATVGGFEVADKPSYDKITEAFSHWDDIDVHYKGEVIRSGGHGFAATSRKKLLNILQERAIELGVQMDFRTDLPPEELEKIRHEYDLVVAGDGIMSGTRAFYAEHFKPRLDWRHKAKFIWAASDVQYDAFKFFFKETPYGEFHVHAYPYDDEFSTFIIETTEEAWRKAGLDSREHNPVAPGESEWDSLKFLEEMFAEELQGHKLIGNYSFWRSFAEVRNENWSYENIVLIGDAVHTAHFAIGSGTKLAMEDAIALRDAFIGESDVPTALANYEAARRPATESLQRAARAAMEWFEDTPRFYTMEPEQFVFHMLTRSRRVTYANLKIRDAAYVQSVDDWFRDQVVSKYGLKGDAAQSRPPMFWPFELRGLTIKNRVGLSPMDMYSAKGDGAATEFHLVHLGARAMGGAGIVNTEMVCVSPEGRITPGDTGLYNDDHEAKWKRVADYVHEWSDAAIGLQIGHAGRKAATKLLWEGMDEPLESGDWEILSASPLPYKPHSQVPRELDRAGMDKVVADFVQTAERGARCGFDMLELHMAHGYLLASFLSPLTNQRTDAYGGSVEARMKFPLEVFEAVRAVWPDDKPMSVRISATDWKDGGITNDEVITIATALKDRRLDIINVSTAQTVFDARPQYGRSWQTPWSDMIRHEVGIPTITAGMISSADDVNSIVLAGRADLCYVGRPHLVDANWTLRAAFDQDYDGPGVTWPDQYFTGKVRMLGMPGSGEMATPDKIRADERASAR